MSKFGKFLKSKAGFTLVELIAVTVILGILCAVAVPVYMGIQKHNRAKVCKVTISKIESDIRVWAMQYPWNIPFGFTIKSDGTVATLGPAPEEGYADLIDYTKSVILNEIFKCEEADVPCCPTKDAVYTVILTPNDTKNYCDVEVTCDGGSDGAHSHD